MMSTDIHKWLIIRLALLWVILSLVIGGLVQYVGRTRLDDHAIKMARRETAPYAAEFISYQRSPSQESRNRFNHNIHGFIQNDNLIVVEFYNSDARKVSAVIKSGAAELKKRLPRHDSEFVLAKDIHCERMTLDNNIFLRVFQPLSDNNGKKFGYLESVYQAPEEIIAQNKRQTLWALALVVLIIFVTSLALYPLIIRLNRGLMDYSRILALTNIGMLEVLGSAIAKRDSDTNAHNFRVTLYSVRLGEMLKLSSVAIQGLIKGAFLHDVGKIAIPDAILLKPGKLTPEEFAIMQTHVGHGGDIIRSYEWLKDADDVVRCHHEKFDGSGYPNGLRGEEIPLNARIFAVADVFDALTSRRPYKEPLSMETSLGIISQARGSHFDPVVADVILTQAEAMFVEICNEKEAVLHNKLEKCIKVYFR